MKKDTEKTNGENLPAISNEDVLLAARESAKSMLAELDDETRAALIAGQQAIKPTMPFAAIRQKSEPGIVTGGLKFNDGRADLELPQQILLLAAKEGRVCWDNDNLQAPPRCKSIDGRTRLEDVPDPGADSQLMEVTRCANCIRRMWPRERNRLSDKHDNMMLAQPVKPENSPECSSVLNLLCSLPDGSDMWIMSLHGTSLKPTNNFFGRIQRMNLPTFGVISELRSDYTQFAKGSCYVAAWELANVTPAPVMKELLSKYPQLLEQLTRDAADFDKVAEREADVSEFSGMSGGYEAEEE